MVATVNKAWGRELIIHNSNLYCFKILEFNYRGMFSMHFHMQKTETWYIQEGAFILIMINTENSEEHTQELHEGETVHILPGQPHQLKCVSNGGKIFEASTQHHDYDSYRIAPGDSQK